VSGVRTPAPAYRAEHRTGLGGFGPKIPNPKKTEVGNTTTIPDRLWTRIGRVTVLTGNGSDDSVVAGFNFDLKFQTTI